MLVTVIWVGAIAAVVGIAGFLLLGRGRFGGGRLGRLARLSRLGARLSASWLGARLRGLFASPEKKRRIDAARREEVAKQVVATMGSMKGAIMKVGQMASFISDDVPPEMQAALASLQASAPAMDFPLLRDVAERELGKPLERAFARFDETPLASASIGQVHRAQLPDGTEVAVKIQYPGVAEALTADLANAGVLYRMVGMMFPGLDPAPVVAELRARFSEELDYRREAENTRAFAGIFAGHPFIRVPDVIDSHSTGRVLTTRFLPGGRFVDTLQGDDARRSRVGEIIYRFAMGSIFRHGLFNGDPHPGNYVFPDDGTVVFLDFGCVKRFSAPMLADWKKLLRAHLDGDRDTFRERAAAFGFFRADADITADLAYGYWEGYYRPFKEDVDFTFTRAYSASTLGMAFKPSGEYAGIEKKLNMPPDFLLVNRIQWGIYSILGQLGSTSNWHRVLDELAFDAAPSTELGLLEEEWRRGAKRATIGA